MLWSVDSCQNSIFAGQYRLTVSRAQVSTHWVRVLFWNYPLTRYFFSNDRRLKFNFFKCMWNKLCSWAAPLKFWMTWDAKIQPAFTCSRFWLFSPWSRVGHALRLIFMLWSKLDRWVHAENVPSIYNLFSDSWSWQSFVSPTCHVFNCLFPLHVQNEYSCYQDSSVIHGWFVYWMRNAPLVKIIGNPISYGIVFAFRLPWRVRGLKRLKWFWPYLMAFRSCISTAGKPQ